MPLWYGDAVVWRWCGMEMVWYGDGAGNTVEENFSIFSLI